jgi:hypothetical protein
MSQNSVIPSDNVSGFPEGCVSARNTNATAFSDVTIKNWKKHPFFAQDTSQHAAAKILNKE